MNDIPTGWQHDQNMLIREFRFENFIAAFGFMAQVALLAETAEHHPNWSNVYGTVRICLTTHDADNTVTQKDIDLARAINKLMP